MAKSNFLVAVVLFLCYVSVDNTEAVLPESCFTTQWPNFTSCVEYGIEGDSRYVHSNSLPPFSVAPYCPYGVGNGYCMKGETDCPFHGMVCPAQEGAPATGDIPVATRTTFNIPAKPDPTNPEKPLPMFHENDQKKWHRHVARSKRSARPPGGHAPDTIGVHVTGVTLFGPSEAGGNNVDKAGLHLICGGHVTPPIGTGPMYHFHKYQSCFNSKAEKAFMEEKKHASGHGELLGWALDGFGLYDHTDVDGKAPVLDQCNGHFGYVPPSDDFSDCKERKSQGQCESQKETMCSQCEKTCGTEVCGESMRLAYHYHSMPNITNMVNTTESPFKPYMLGCQGPSKGLCAQNTEDPRQGVVWCGKGCGYQLCVQPAVQEKDLEAYVSSFGSSDWLKKYTINPY